MINFDRGISLGIRKGVKTRALTTYYGGSYTRPFIGLCALINIFRKTVCY